LKGYIKCWILYQLWLTFVTECLKCSVHVYTAPFDIRNFPFSRSVYKFNTILTSTICLCVQYYSWVFRTGTGAYLCELRSCSQKHTFIFRCLMTVFNTRLPPRQTASKDPSFQIFNWAHLTFYHPCTCKYSVHVLLFLFWLAK
jgi:hypothetical protein